MARSYMENFKRDDGYPISVEYEYSPGSETTYSPMHGAVGGDGCTVSIIKAWPNTPRFDRVYGLMNSLRWDCRRWWQRPLVWLGYPVLKAIVWAWEKRAFPNTAERERMEDEIAEKHVYEPAEEDYF